MTELKKKSKILEQLHDMSFDACVEFLLQMELIAQFNTTQENAYIVQVDISEEKENFNIFKYCNMRHETNVLPFRQVCRS